MEDELNKLYQIQEEYQWRLTEEVGSTDADFNYGYKFTGGVNEGINEVPKEKFIIGDTTITYSIRNIRGNPKILLSHPFEEIEKMLENR